MSFVKSRIKMPKTIILPALLLISALSLLFSLPIFNGGFSFINHQMASKFSLALNVAAESRQGSLHHLWPVVQAQSPTSSATPSATNSAELRQAIRERIEETLQEGESSPLYQGYIGVIDQVSTATFSFTSPLGSKHTVQLLSDATIISGNSNIELDDLVVGNGVSVIGNPLDELVIEAKRIIMSDNNYEETRQVHLGTIIEITSGELVFQTRGQNGQTTWIRNTTTEYEDSLGATITAAQLEENQAALVVTDEDSSGDRFVKRVHLLVAMDEVN